MVTLNIISKVSAFRVQVDGGHYFTALGCGAWGWVGVIFGLIAKLDPLLNVT